MTQQKNRGTGLAVAALPDHPALSARGLSAGFARRPYLSAVDFEIGHGEVVAVLGANGAGKTTLIMTLAGHLRARQGELRIDGHVVRSGLERRVRDERIALITQERCVFMTLTVRQNLRLARCPLDEALEMFPELEPHADRRVASLSGGQQQMLAVARALASRPRLVLADEVSLGLGPQVVDRLLGVLSSAASERGVAVAIVEQYVHKALQFSDRAYVMQRGRVALSGSSSDLSRNVDSITELYL